MRKRNKALTALLTTMILVLALPAALSAPALPPDAVFPDLPEFTLSWVFDYAGILDEASIILLNAYMDALYNTTQAHFVIVTCDDLLGLTGKEYAVRLFNKWGLGNSTRNDGLLLLLSPANRMINLTPGAGIAHVFEGESAGRILDDFAIPYLRGTPDYNLALLNCAEEICRYYLKVYLEEGVEYDCGEELEKEPLLRLPRDNAGALLMALRRRRAPDAFAYCPARGSKI